MIKNHKHDTKKNIFVLLLLFFFCYGATTSHAEDLNKPKQKSPPFYKLVSVNAEFSMHPGGDYYLKQDGDIIEQGENDIYTKASVGVSMPLLRIKKTFVLGSIKYSHIHRHFNASKQILDYGLGTASHHLFSANVLASGSKKIGSKTIKFTGMLNGECSQYGFERWMAMGSAVYMLKETSRTELGVGLIGMVNTFSKIPVFPFFTYRHTFNERWMLNIIPPIMHVRYTHTASDIFTFGTSFAADHYFIRPNTQGLPNRVRYNRSMFNICATYEHKFPAKISAVLDIGYSIIITDRISKSGSSKELAEVHEDNIPYCRITIRKGF